MEVEIPYWQVVDEDGHVSPEHEPTLSREQVVRLFETLVRIKTFEARMMNLQRAGRIGFYGGSIGQEATATGSAFALEPQDWVFPQYREPGAALVRGISMETLLYQFMSTGKDIGKGRQMPVHYGDSRVNFVTISSVVGSQVPAAAGAAWAMRLRKKDEVAIVYFGDGGTSTQDFHVGMNFAGVYRAPCIFWCNNNQYAISIPREKQTAARTIAQKAMAYGFEGFQVDGQDIISVYAAAKYAADKARKGGGPTLVESITYRLGPHSSSDDPSRYRTDEEVDRWRKRDTVERVKHYLRAKGWWQDGMLEKARGAADEEVSHAIEAAEAAGPPAWTTLVDDVFATPSPHLEWERRDLGDFFAWRDGGAN